MVRQAQAPFQSHRTQLLCHANRATRFCGREIREDLGIRNHKNGYLVKLDYSEDLTMKKFITKFIRDEEGASMVEYGLLVALIAIVAITGVALLGTNTNTAFGNAGKSISS